MRTLAAALLLIFTIAGTDPATAQQKTPPKRATAQPKYGSAACIDAARPGKLLSREAGFAFQVLLDAKGFSPGLIDADLGTNASRALSAFQAANNLPVTGAPDCATWEALGGSGAAVTADYTITVEDAEGPFTETIPSELPEQAKLKALNYRSIEERLAEKFHVAPALLKSMNRGVAFRAGAQIKVPAVTPFDVTAKPTARPTAGAKNGAAPAAAGNAPKSDVTVEVSRDESNLRVIDGTGALLMYAPVSSGSEHDPLPLGTWRVNGVGWMPKFNYNPDLFWDANPAHSKATIPPGPNNPVGVVWIDISVEHYGLHGTPEPSRVGHAQSHGCVRLTNWDAARLAALVRPGTTVVFK